MLLVAYDIPNGDGVRVGSCITLSFKHARRILHLCRVALDNKFSGLPCSLLEYIISGAC